MSAPLGQYSPEQFLYEYWQKKPCLIRQAFNDFKPLLSGDDLAGLACEEMAESRLVSGSMEASDWQLAHGPFDERDFSSLPEENWTLLVQDVEKHYAPLQDLMQMFSFIPGWRLDDLMISYAVTGGSVGPHADQYDVFLFQAEGSRRWQIARSFDPELLEDCPLNVLRTFTAEQEWILEAGDMLYLPPGTSLPVRVHGAFVADNEVHNVVRHLKKSGLPRYIDEILEGPSSPTPGLVGIDKPAADGVDAEQDPLYDQAVQVVMETRKASISGVQRRLKIGYNRAARMVESMEAAGLVGPLQPNGSREILVPNTADE